MKHYRLLLLGLLLCLTNISDLYAQHMKVGGMLHTTREVDSLRADPLVTHKQKSTAKLLTKIQNKTGRVSMNLQLDILRFSPFRIIEQDSLSAEYPPLLTQKKFQLQLKLGIQINLQKKKRSK